MAHLLKHRKNGKLVWSVRWVDATRGTGKAGRREARCATGSHREAFDAAGWGPEERAAIANGARNGVQRDRIRKAYEALEVERMRDAARAGGAGRGSRFDTPLLALLDEYFADMESDVAVRDARGGRAGKARGTLELRRFVFQRFRQWLASCRLSRITTGDLAADQLRRYRDWLVRQTDARSGKPLSPAYVNTNLRGVKAFVNRYLDDDDPRPYFRASSRSISRALKSVEADHSLPERFSPDELQGLLQTAITLDLRETVQVKRSKGKTGKAEQFRQGHSFSRLFPWAALLMLTGCRVHEAAGLKWSDVDLEHGSIIFRSRKTGRERRILLDDHLDRVSTGLLTLLRAWRVQKPDAVFVLPENGAEGQAVFPKHPWDTLCKTAGIKVRPKALRSNWVSYMAALGRPATTVALMAGHSPVVLERHYLSYAHARLAGDSLDDAMGVAPLLRVALGGSVNQGATLYRIGAGA